MKLPNEIAEYISPEMFKLASLNNDTLVISALDDNSIELRVLGTTQFVRFPRRSYDTQDIHMKIVDIFKNPDIRASYVLLKFLAKSLE